MAYAISLCHGADCVNVNRSAKDLFPIANRSTLSVLSMDADNNPDNGIRAVRRAVRGLTPFKLTPFKRVEYLHNELPLVPYAAKGTLALPRIRV